jgi:two-component system, OmpR family, alkaline phosphatase synthesis response regulator PhoP
VIRVCILSDRLGHAVEMAVHLNANGISVSIRMAERLDLEDIAIDLPDILVLDLLEHPEHGVVTLRWLRQTVPAMGVIAVTTPNGTNRVFALMKAGADTFINEPVEPRFLEAVIRSLVRRLHITTPAD